MKSVNTMRSRTRERAGVMEICRISDDMSSTGMFVNVNVNVRGIS